VQQILVLLKRTFSWVVVDLGLPLDETATALLDGADLIIMTFLPEMVGLRNAQVMLDQLYRRGHRDEKVWLLLNRAEMRGGVPVGDIEERLGIRLEHTVPDDAPLVTHSINRGVPLVMSHGRSAVARAVRTLARQLMDELSEQGPKAGLMERLLGRARAGDA
jgi:pilus assembly protein CpaE